MTIPSFDNSRPIRVVKVLSNRLALGSFEAFRGLYPYDPESEVRAKWDTLPRDEFGLKYIETGP